MHSLLFRRRGARLLAALLALGAAAACSDPFEIEAQFDTTQATLTVYGLNGSLPTQPSAVALVATPAAVRLDASYLFDFAIDFRADGTPVLYPVDLVASGAVLSPSRRVGIRPVGGTTFEAMTVAPTGGYTFREAIPLAVGDLGYIQSNAHPFCVQSFTPQVYSKYRVDAIDPVARTVRLTIRSDPNCGFRGLDTGLPTR